MSPAMSEALIAHYPLRANAYGLVKGAPLATFQQRLKVAALVYDKLILDDGAWIGTAGPGGATDLRLPVDDEVAPTRSLQSGAERRSAQGGRFGIAVNGHPIIQSAATLSWRATYRPIKDELPEAYDWIDFVAIELKQNGKAVANNLAEEDEQAGLLAAQFPDSLVRAFVLKGASQAMVLASELGLS
ncbi:MAG: hypothetical protein ACRDGD_07285 [Candidatus Limnocylindria bacterium]